jgi:hypothetical protein
MSALWPLLTTIGWTPRVLAEKLEINQRKAERWASGTLTAPAHVVAWLERVAAGVEAEGLPEGWMKREG